VASPRWLYLQPEGGGLSSFFPKEVQEAAKHFDVIYQKLSFGKYLYYLIYAV